MKRIRRLVRLGDSAQLGHAACERPAQDLATADEPVEPDEEDCQVCVVKLNRCLVGGGDGGVVTLSAARPQHLACDATKPAARQLLFSRTPGTTVEPPRLMRSGNVSDEPLCFSNEDARTRISDIADEFLMYDREIAVSSEDPLVTLFDDAERPIRRSRGCAPLPVILPETGRLPCGWAQR